MIDSGGFCLNIGWEVFKMNLLLFLGFLTSLKDLIVDWLLLSKRLWLFISFFRYLLIEPWSRFFFFLVLRIIVNVLKNWVGSPKWMVVNIRRIRSLMIQVILIPLINLSLILIYLLQIRRILNHIWVLILDRNLFCLINDSQWLWLKALCFIRSNWIFWIIRQCIL